MNRQRDFLWAEWPAPAPIRAGTTTRRGGVSPAPYDCMNLGMRTGDCPQAVRQNRALLRSALDLPGEPAWLEQVHGRNVVSADAPAGGPADASVAYRPDSVCAVLTADCLPVVFCDRAGRCWAAAHAGWRGLAAGVLEATIDRMPAVPDQIMAWFGPAIGAHNFEVGDDVREAFVADDPGVAPLFVPAAGRYYASIDGLARRRLRRAGVEQIYGGRLCTVDDAERFYSYRRVSPTGRMATLVWSDRERHRRVQSWHTSRR